MAEIFEMKQGDLKPDFEIVLKSNNTPVDLSTAEAVYFTVEGMFRREMTIADQEEDPGKVIYEWQEDDTNVAGDYNVEIEVIWEDDRPQTWPASRFVTLSISPDASVDDYDPAYEFYFDVSVDLVRRLTGTYVTSDEVIQAQTFIELHSGRFFEEIYSSISDRDAYWLRLAIVYEAKYIHDSPDFFERTDVSSYSQAGVTFNLAPEGIQLAPLAKRALLNLSWKRSRKVGAGVRRNYNWYADLPEHGGWEPL